MIAVQALESYTNILENIIRKMYETLEGCFFSIKICT